MIQIALNAGADATASLSPEWIPEYVVVTVEADSTRIYVCTRFVRQATRIPPFKRAA